MLAPPQKRARLNGPVVQRLDRESYLQQLRKVVEPMVDIRAMYNSLVNGIVTDKELMGIPIHDHAVVRGHAVFDTCAVINGRMYRVDAHLDRHLRGAQQARIPLPFEGSVEENKERMRSIIGQTIVASGLRRCSVRYFTTVGPGTLGLVPAGCTSAFYVVVYLDHTFGAYDQMGVVKEYTVDVPLKPSFLATTKSNNYMLNALTAMASQDRGGKFGVLVDADGNVAESSVMNCAFVTNDLRFITPTFDHILAGTTVQKVMGFAKRLVDEGLLKAVSQEIVPVSVAKNCVEMMIMSGDTCLCAVTHWDDKPVGSGEVGPVARRLFEMLMAEASAGEGVSWAVGVHDVANALDIEVYLEFHTDLTAAKVIALRRGAEKQITQRRSCYGLERLRIHTASRFTGLSGMTAWRTCCDTPRLTTTSLPT